MANGSTSLGCTYLLNSSGNYVFNATVNNTAGTSTTTPTRNTTVDLTTPSITLVSPSSGSFNTTQLINISANGTNLDEIEIFVNGTEVQDCMANGSTSLGCTYLLNSSGNYVFNATVNNTAGTSTTTPTRNTTVDLTTPSITLVSPSSGSFNTTQLINISANGTNLDEIEIFVNGTEVQDCMANGSTSLGCTYLLNSSGNYVFNATVNNTAGTSTTTPTRNTTVDLTTPSITLVSPSSGSFNTTQLINISANGTNLDEIEIFVNGTEVQDCMANGSTSLGCTYLLNSSGNYVFNATVNNTAGGSNTTGSISVSVELSAPAVSFVSPTPVNGSYNTSQLLKVEDSGLDLDTIEIFVNNTSVSTCTSSPCFYTLSSDGNYIAYAMANDTAGLSNTTDTRNVTIDSEIPAISFVSPTPSNGSYNASQSINVSVTDPSIDTIIIYVNGSIVQTCHSSPCSYTLTTEGKYSFFATANNTAGASNTTETNNITIDLTGLQWSSPEANESTVYWNDTVGFNATWTDNFALAGYIFYINQSGNLTHSSYIPFTGTSNVSNGTRAITAPAGTTVYWYFWANDTSGNSNQTDVQNFTVQARNTSVAFALNQSVYPQSNTPTGEFQYRIPLVVNYTDNETGLPIAGANCYVTDSETDDNVSLAYNATTGEYTGSVDDDLMSDNVTFTAICSEANYYSASNSSSAEVWWLVYPWELNSQTFGPDGNSTTQWLMRESPSGTLFTQSFLQNTTVSDDNYVTAFFYSGAGTNRSLVQSYTMLGQETLTLNVSVNDTSCTPYLCTDLYDSGLNPLLEECGEGQGIPANTPTVLNESVPTNYSIQQGDYISMLVRLNCTSAVPENLTIYYNYTGEPTSIEVTDPITTVINGYIAAGYQLEPNYTMGPNQTANSTAEVLFVLNNTGAVPQYLDYYLVLPINPPYTNSISPSSIYIYNSTGQLCGLRQRIRRRAQHRRASHRTTWWNG